MSQVLVLGAGVIGLTSGILLLREGYQVTIWAKDLPPNTTSNKAAAVWYPFLANPPEKVTRWAQRALDFYRREVLPDPASGTMPIKVVELFEQPKADPWWKDGVDTYRRATGDELPAGYVDGYAIDALVMDTDIYMDYLVAWFRRMGGVMIQREIHHIDEALNACDVVVNCTGLGAKTLLNDTEMYPCRGQVLRIKPNEFPHSLFEEEGRNSLAYMIPRLSDMVIGGTSQDHNESLEPDPQDTADILRKCAGIYPQFANAEILEVRVGLRPSRTTIRLEAEQRGDTLLIHNYGHGGSGVTICWGCAMDVVNLVVRR